MTSRFLPLSPFESPGVLCLGRVRKTGLANTGRGCVLPNGPFRNESGSPCRFFGPFENRSRAGSAVPGRTRIRALPRRRFPAISPGRVLIARQRNNDRRLMGSGMGKGGFPAVEVSLKPHAENDGQTEKQRLSHEALARAFRTRETGNRRTACRLI